VARPTDYCEEMNKKALDYLENYEEVHGDSIPSVAGLAVSLGVAKSTVYLWKGLHDEFSDTLDRIMTSQERKALNNGINGVFNATITKLVLANHGYSEASTIQQNLTVTDGETLAERLTGGSKR